MGSYGVSMGVCGFLNVYGCLWVSSSFYKCLWVFLSVYECHGCIWLVMDVYGYL